jgi:hypothetical protein
VLSRHGRFDYGVLYAGFYIASNILGILLMLVNLGELRRRWRGVRTAFREDRRTFARMLVVDALTFTLIYIMGRLVASLL